jgi:hypothetical protein
MSGKLSRGILALSIDVELATLNHDPDQRRALEAITGRLVDLVGKHSHSATWAVADPAVSAATERVMGLGAPQEMAVLGDATWVGPIAGRGRFARELQRRVTAGRAAGLNISTLVLRDCQLGEHWELLVKHGLSVLCEMRGGKAAPAEERPVVLHYGLTSVPVSLVAPLRRRWLSRVPVGEARRGIDRAAAGCGLFHLAINALALAGRGPAGLRQLDRVLRHADARRREGTLSIETLSAAARHWSDVPRAAPAQSILRAAA